MIAGLVLAVGLLAWTIQDPLPPVYVPPPEPEPSLSRPVIDIQETIDGSIRNAVLPGSVCVFYTHADAEDSISGHLVLVGAQTAQYSLIVGDNSDNGNERVGGTSDGTWYVAVDAQHDDGTLVRSDEVSFTISGATIVEGAANPNPDPGPTPDPDPGPITETVRLEWDAPTTNEDGSALDDLAMYAVRQGVEPSTYSTTLTTPISDNPTLQVTLSPGRHYFCVMAVDFYGNESFCSNEVMHEVQ